MAPLQRLILALCAGLLAAGVGAVSTLHGGQGHTRATPSSARYTTRPGTPGAAPDTTQAGPPAAAPDTTQAGPPAAAPEGSAALQAGLITPTDMGGYYRTVPTQALAFLASAPCLTPLERGRTESGWAATALLGPNAHSVPQVVEVVASYAPPGAPRAYDQAVATLDRCPGFSFESAGQPVNAEIGPGSIPEVGDADRVWSGSFTAAGQAFTLQIGVVLNGPDVLALVWVDGSPPSDPEMGSFASTVSLAIGKLA